MIERFRRWLKSLNAGMTMTLLAAFAAAMALYCVGIWLGECGINWWYMNGEAVAERNLMHLRSLQQYVQENDVSSRDSAAIEVWARAEKNSSVIVYRDGDGPYETGWWGTDPLLDDVEQADISELGYGFFPLAFSDGVFQVAVCDVSEVYLYDAVQIGCMVLAFVLFVLIMLTFVRRTTKRIVRLSAAVNAVSGGALEEEIAEDGTDEIARLADDVNHMRTSIIDRAYNEQKAWQANSDLITAMSHDIRNPLTSLIGYLELLEMSANQLPEEQRKYVLSSLDKAYRLKDLTGEMFRYFLVFGRQEQELEMEIYDAQILLEQLLGEYVAELRTRGYRVHTIELPTPCSVCTDVHMLKRVVDNLMSNILKYADPKQRVTVLAGAEDGHLHICFANRTRRISGEVESNHIGLRTCDAVMKLLGGEFCTYREADGFTAELVLPLEQEADA